MEKMNNRVYGIVGIKSKMACWNADFSGRPRTTSNGIVFGSDKAFKYPIKKMWESQGEKVLYVKSYKDGTLQARSLAERFEKLFGKSTKSIKNKEDVVRELFSAIDVQNFGATFPEGGINLSVTGAVQVGQGLNKFEESSVEIMDILSPFIDNTKPEAGNTSIGKKIVSDEAHYIYPFTVNPENYNIYTEEVSGLDGYTKEAYAKFKEACLVAVTAYNTNSKMGCENELAIFIECIEGSKLYLTNLDDYVKFNKVVDGKDIIDITDLASIINAKDIEDQIANVEIYYNPYTTEIKGKINKAMVKELF